MDRILGKSKNTRINSKQRILETASNLFSEFGFLGTSMGNIAKKLNITKAALYYHFRSKKELYLQVLEKSFQDLIKNINRGVAKAKSPDEIIYQLIQSYFKFGLKEKNLIKCLTLKTPDIDPEIINYISELRMKIDWQFQSFLKEILKGKSLIQKVDLKFTTSFLLGTIDRMILEASLFNKSLNIRKKSFQILQMINPILKVGINK